MYEVSPESLKTFIEDKSIKLPRFQRKLTWKDKNNFLLAISLFKDYPIGVVIIHEQLENDNKTKWLLDGRQRRHAMSEMYYDPEVIYRWSESFIGFKKSEKVGEIEDKFWKKISEYIEAEPKKDLRKDSTEEENNIENEILDSESTIDSEQNLEKLDQKFILKYKKSGIKGLNLLLKLIIMGHSGNKKDSGIVSPFNYSDYFDGAPYIEKGRVNGKKLKLFVSEYLNYCNSENTDYKIKENYLSFSKNRLSSPKSKNNYSDFEQNIENNWNATVERIELFKMVDEQLQSAKIGIITIREINLTDAQKIFNIINTAGTQLTAAEILSAKPFWNKTIKNPEQDLVKAKNELYNLLGVTPVDVVKWDIPATFLSRIKENDFLFSKTKNDIESFETKVTLGFKMLSAIYQKGITKDDLDALSVNKDVEWSDDIETLISRIEILITLISKNNYFRFLRSWNVSIKEIIQDTPTINFITLLYFDWKRKGFPLNDNNSKKVQKNAFILFDRLIYEYLTKQWRGSSDSKISKNLSLNELDDIFIPIEEQKWLDLLNEIFEEYSLSNDKIKKHSTLGPILYHYYCLKEIAPNGGPDTKYEIEHIYPKTLFDNAADMDNKDLKKNALINLALFPKSENIKKSNFKLNEINDEWLIQQIERLSEINRKDFDTYSNLNNFEMLKEIRKKLIKEAFTNKRRNILNNQ
jgi:hypothetical protein